MKRLVPLIVVVAILAAFVFTLRFLYQKSQAQPVVFETETPMMTDIIKKTVATGALVPRQEVEIKPRVSGIVDKLYVQPGQKVATGDLIADISIVPDVANLNQAEAQVRTARLAFESAKRELERYQGLFNQRVISDAELRRYKDEHDLRKQELDTAVANLQIVKEGARKSSTQKNTEVRSTVAGMVLEVPVKEGQSVIESNTFNAGTTVALIADMGDMIFQGKVDEAEVGKLKEGMELDLKIGALDDELLKGKLEYIAPKGAEAEGVIQFEVKAAITAKEGVFLRANYSANADIVLDRRSQVLAIREALLQFDEQKKPYVEVEVSPQQFERRDIQVGLSDGINIEVVSGLDRETRIKKPITTEEDDKGPGGQRRGPRRR